MKNIDQALQAITKLLLKDKKFKIHIGMNACLIIIIFFKTFLDIKFSKSDYQNLIGT